MEAPMKKSLLMINAVAAATLLWGSAVAQAQEGGPPQTVCHRAHCPQHKNPGQPSKSGALREMPGAVPRIEATTPQTPQAVQEGRQAAHVQKRLVPPKPGRIEVQNPMIAARRAHHRVMPPTGEEAGQVASTRPENHAQVAAAATNEPATTGSVRVANLNRSQRQEIRTSIREEHVRRIPHVDFTINVGVTVPRTIVLHRLPRRFVELVPVYEGYEFFELTDGSIIIVDPVTLQIVSVIYA
jgi:hypothetical protein